MFSLLSKILIEAFFSRISSFCCTIADQDNVRDPNSPFVNLGIITSNGSLFSVAFTAKLQHSVTGPVIVPAAHQSGVALYWQSDTLISSYSFNTGSYVWTICLRDGRMLMWSVPFFTRNDFRNPCDTSVVDVRLNVDLLFSPLSSEGLNTRDCSQLPQLFLH